MADAWLPPEPLTLSFLRAVLLPLVPSSGGRKAAFARAIDAAADSARADSARAFLPSYLASPDSDTAAVPDGLAAALWPAVRARLEAALAQEVSSRMAALKAPFFAPPRLESLSLGGEPLRLGAVHCPLLGGGGGGGASVVGVAPPEDAAVVEADVMWGGGGGGGEGGQGEGEGEGADPCSVTVSFGPEELDGGGGAGGGGRGSWWWQSWFSPRALAARLLPRLFVTLAEPQLLLRARLVLRPVTPDPPFVGSAAVTLLAPPHVDCALRVGLAGPAGPHAGGAAAPLSSSPSIDLMALPVLGPLLRTLLRRLLTARLAYPRCACVELSPGGSRPPRPQGVLRLRALRAEGLKRAEGGVAPARRPYVAVEVRQGRAQRTRACPGRTHDPRWGQGEEEGEEEGQALDFVVDDPRRQSLVVAVCEEPKAGAGGAALAAAAAAAFSPALSRLLGLAGGGGGRSAPPPPHVLGVAQIAPLAEADFVARLPGERVPPVMVLRQPLGGGVDAETPPVAAASPPAAASAAAAAAAESLHLRGTLFMEATYLPFEQPPPLEEEEEEGPGQAAVALPLALTLLLGGGGGAGAGAWAGGAPALASASAAAAALPDPRARGFLTVAVDHAGDLAFARGGADEAAVCVELRVGDPLPLGGAPVAGQSQRRQRERERRLVQRSSVVHGQRSPRWAGEKHDFCFVSLASVLVVTVMDVGGKGGGGGGGGPLLGRQRVMVAEAAAAGGRARRRLPLAGALTGYVEISLEWTPAGGQVMMMGGVGKE